MFCKVKEPHHNGWGGELSGRNYRLVLQGAVFVIIFFYIFAEINFCIDVGMCNLMHMAYLYC